MVRAMPAPRSRSRKSKRPTTRVIEVVLKNVRDLVVRVPNKSELARLADVDEKSVRLASRPDWNPRASTLARFAELLPEGWRAGDPLPAPFDAYEKTASRVVI